MAKPSQQFESSLSIAFLVTALSLYGCSSQPAAIAPPDVDPDNLVTELLELHDRDGDGSLSDNELQESPAVRDRMSVYDADGNNTLSREELQARLHKVFDGRTGLMAAACRVTRNGSPLKGAIVHFVPIPLLENSLPVASGVTRSNGTTPLSIRQENLPPNSPQRDGFVRPGLYLVEVTHPDLKIPEQYNTKTKLGREVSPPVALAGAIELPLEF